MRMLFKILFKHFLKLFEPDARCRHFNTSIHVISVAATCEKAVLICDDCGKELDEPITDC